MQRLIILNTREIKKIREMATGQFGHFPTDDYVYLRSEKNKVFLVNKDVGRINLRNLIVDKIGLYFAEIRNGDIRLSKEGAQLLVRDARKHKKKVINTLALDNDEVKKYFQGEDLKKDLGADNRLILLHHRNETIGCAQYKEGRIINFLPKLHRGEVIV